MPDDRPARPQGRKFQRRPIVKLHSRMRRMVELMTVGTPVDPSATPFTLLEAAERVGYSQRAAREIGRSQVFRAAFHEASSNWRTGTERAGFGIRVHPEKGPLGYRLYKDRAPKQEPSDT